MEESGLEWQGSDSCTSRWRHSPANQVAVWSRSTGGLRVKWKVRCHLECFALASKRSNAAISP